MTEADYQKLKAEIDALQQRLWEIENRAPPAPVLCEQFTHRSPFTWTPPVTVDSWVKPTTVG